MKTVLPLLPAVLLSAAPTAGKPDAPAAKPSDDPIRVFLATHCRECHSGSKPKGDFRTDDLSADFNIPANRDKWRTALKRVQAAEMPPTGRPRPATKEIAVLAGWVSDSQTIKPGNRMPPNALPGDDLQALLSYLERLK